MIPTKQKNSHKHMFSKMAITDHILWKYGNFILFIIGSHGTVFFVSMYNIFKIVFIL